MAVVTNKSQVITGSSTRTLGTLGRSVFNSTIGTFADKDTMNQIYGTIDKLSSSIETVDKTIDFEAFNGRNKPDDLFALIAGLDIKSSYDFMNKNREFMKRLMRLNKQEKDITLDAIGVDTTGESNVVRNEHVANYEYVEDNNYYENYVKTLSKNQQVGDETTTLQLESSTNFNYAGKHNDLYVVNRNLYPDDENRGSFANKWIVENRNSLLYKTKKLFNSKKINTIISRFHTDPSRPASLLDNAKSKYGLSHGRNLLTKQAEDSLNTAYANGYDNPYCRVWTHHHQYDRYYKTIRPFSQIDDQGNYVGTMSVQDFHTWGQFSDEKDNNAATKGEWGWKKESNNGWQNTVLQDNGLVNITPKYVKGGGASNIHTKQCMFSIENLAWRGYDPYSFEQALSWEQRGPLGGRIMWFPPYGIQFNETTTTQWTNTQFLGRGEDVYTYSNTTRTGSLSFMMVVDHPSILDYVTWNKENKNVTDTDILRFLAGCGEGDGRGLRDLATPTPLTDEFTQVHDTAAAIEKIEEVVPAPIPEVIPEEITPEEPEITPEEEKPLPKAICFYVFYPNNYSGTYDDHFGGEGYSKDSTSLVEAIPFLLAGKGAQKSAKNASDKTDTGYQSAFAHDIALNKDTKYENAVTSGGGYEMSGSGLGKQEGFIYGTRIAGARWSNIKGLENSNYRVSGGGKWYYRIDGRYVYPKDSSEKKMNYYCQVLGDADGYIDNTCYGLNKNITAVCDNMDTVKKSETDDGYEKYIYNDNEEMHVFTLAEVAYVLYKEKEGCEKLVSACGFSGSEKRIEELKKILSDKDRIKTVKGEGFASAQGYSQSQNGGDSENIVLSRNRAKTASNWFANTLEVRVKPTAVIESPNENNIGAMQDGDKKNQGGYVSGDHNSVQTKRTRYAKVIIEFTSVEKKGVPATDPNQTVEEKKDEASTNPPSAKRMAARASEAPSNHSSEEEKQNLANNNGGKTYVGYNKTGEIKYVDGVECDVYTDMNKKKWYLDKEKQQFVSLEYAAEYEDGKTPKARYGEGGNGDENRLRYDQEYHFFKVLKQTDPVVYGSLMDKLQYFDPAFHSMTPEGFNGRLTFLQQCMRQGNTVSASDGKFSKSANNLAFGRAPYCVLRLGDFYNQMIVIDNLTINYDPLVWDLNVEGIGVQPLIAHVQLSFKFVGGGDLTGPVRRLQNAMSFNYYANARLYDNRADRVERMWSDKTNGAIEHDEIINDVNPTDAMSSYYGKDKNGNMKNSSAFYTTKMYK